CNCERSVSISPISGRDALCAVVQDNRTRASDSAPSPHRVGSCAASLLATLSSTSVRTVSCVRSASDGSWIVTDVSACSPILGPLLVGSGFLSSDSHPRHVHSGTVAGSVPLSRGNSRSVPYRDTRVSAPLERRRHRSATCTPTKTPV